MGFFSQRLTPRLGDSMDWLITLSGDVNSACFNDAGNLGGMTSPTQAK